MTIDRWITQAEPSAPALIYAAKTWRYDELAVEIAARAQALVAHNVRPGDRVAWYGLNHPEVFILLFACARIGAMLVPLNWRLAEGEVTAIVQNCAPKLIVYDDHFAAAAQALSFPSHRVGTLQGQAEDVPQGTKEDPLLLVYTSGSTGRPKGVVLTQKALIANAAMSVEAHGLTAQDRVLNALPLFHVGGLNILPMPAFSVGASVELHEKFDPLAMAEALTRVQHGITVPTVLQAVLASQGWSDRDLSGLKTLSIGSTDVPLDLIEAIHTRGVPMMQIYGATETSPFAIYQTAQDAMSTVGSIGRAGTKCQIRLVADGVDVADGRPGEIWVKGDNILREYWRDPDLSAEMIQDGWFKTGDVAVRHPDGQYYFADRIKHVIISGGENIYPAEIERILRNVDNVSEVAVVGRPDPKWGEVPVAVVVGDATRDDILRALDGRLARYKHPKDVVYIDALPRNAMGKVVAAEVRKQIGVRNS